MCRGSKPWVVPAIIGTSSEGANRRYPLCNTPFFALIISPLPKDCFWGDTNKPAVFFPPTGGYKYSFCSIFRDLQDLHTFAPLQTQNFVKISSNFLVVLPKILQKSLFKHVSSNYPLILMKNWIEFWFNSIFNFAKTFTIFDKKSSLERCKSMSIL